MEGRCKDSILEDFSMAKPVVAIKRYENSPNSLRELLDLCGGLDELATHHHVFIKPNLVAWDDKYPMPLYGVYTTTRLVHDMVLLLKERGVERITIAEGSAHGKRFGVGTDRIYKVLGYHKLATRYGVTLMDILQEPFENVDFGGFTLQVSKPALEADFLINMPALKTHNQGILSLGMKNLKGCLSIKSRKYCHRPDHSLDHYLSLFVEKLRPALTVLDGIYGLEKGPFYMGKAVRMNALVASKDPLAVDAVGATLAGLDPSDVPHIKGYADRHSRSLDLDQWHLRGTPLEALRRPLKWDNRWREDNTGPRAWKRMGIQGISIPKYDKTLCTGCSGLYSPVLVMIMSAHQGIPFNEIEILTGKAMKPSGKASSTVLLGNCMIKANRKDTNIREAVFVKGCPPTMDSIQEAMERCGIHPNMDFYKKHRRSLMERYEGKEGFDEGFFYMK
jgi:uncharacterized protein (DUF362 family)